jgi:hypothetical protein
LVADGQQVPQVAQKLTASPKQKLDPSALQALFLRSPMLSATPSNGDDPGITGSQSASSSGRSSVRFRGSVPDSTTAVLAMATELARRRRIALRLQADIAFGWR